MKRYGLVLVGLLLAACSLQGPSASPTATPAAASCRLPVLRGDPWQPGFLELPSRTFTAATDAGGGTYYDRALKRWIPWGPPYLSSDGARYVYVDGSQSDSRVHLHDVATGTEQILATGGPWQVAALGDDAVYLVRVEYVNGPAYGSLAFGKGLWKAPLDGTRPVQLTNDAWMWQWAHDGSVFSSGAVDVAGGPNDVYRFDVATMKVSTVFSRHLRSRVLAVDESGAALVLAEGADEELWRVTLTGDTTELWSGTTDGLRPEAPVAVDGADVWFSSSMAWPETEWAVYHYSAHDGFRQEATFTDGRMVVAGGCR